MMDMNRRRSRYTANLYRNGQTTQKVILAYTATSVRDFYERQGYEVRSVRKGDFRREAQKAEIKRNAEGFRFDQANIREAIAMLGIEWPVDIVTDSRVGGTGGNHTLIYSGGGCYHRNGRIFNLAHATTVRHRIMVKDYLSVSDAGRVLWHELTHAMQSEREAREAGVDIPEDIHRAWSQRKARHKGTYKHSPLEIEANRNMPYNDACPLAR